MNRRRTASSRRRTVLLVGVVMLMVAAVAAVAGAPTARSATADHPLSLSVASENGRGRSVSPGRPCETGSDGVGAYWHYDYDTEMAPGVLSPLGGEVLAHLDIRSGRQPYQNLDGAYPDGADPAAYLGGAESTVSLLDSRGSVKLRLSSGSCEAPTLAFDGSVAAGSGTWAVDSGSGAYRDVTGSGTFTLSAEVNPGADNALDLQLDGLLSSPTPELEVTVVRTFWAGLGTDYLTRRVSVEYRVSNVGTGDAFGAVVTGISNPTSGVDPMVGSGFSLPLPDLPACLPDGSNQDRCSETFVVRHQMGLLLGPCALLILGCQFDTTITADLPDAFGVPSVQSDTVRVRAPDLPPPL